MEFQEQMKWSSPLTDRRFYQLMPGMRKDCPLTSWSQYKVSAMRMTYVGTGRIVAVKRVGDVWLAGVDFGKPVEGGHSLMMRTEGQPCPEGHGLWFWLDFLTPLEPVTSTSE